MRRAIIALAAGCLLAGCNTIEGVGNDLAAVGNTLAGAASDTKASSARTVAARDAKARAAKAQAARTPAKPTKVAGRTCGVAPFRQPC